MEQNVRSLFSDEKEDFDHKSNVVFGESNAAEKTKTDEATWPDFYVGIYDKLTSQNANLTYEFNDLNISIPSKLGDDSEHFLWKLNGVLKIRSSNNNSDKESVPESNKNS